ncbi:MAG: hypothetical protein A2Y07_07350 [Planctomycetes bacterium GWF2_50_10]|nr:MAG: hypothetical protein A2Y07_07350 [Planctomycetes bacterium GWF2_50_10]
MQEHQFKIAPIRWPAYAFIAALLIVILIPLTAIKSANHYHYSAAVVFTIILLVASLFTYILYTGNRMKFTLTDSHLIIRALYGKTIPRQNLLTNQARLIDFQTEKDLKPFWRTNGIGLPGYSQGWYSSRNHKHKYLVFATDSRRALLIPTTLGYSILLTPASPAEFLTHLTQTS